MVIVTTVRTNAAVIIDEDGNVSAGSKSRIITPGKRTDNFGFAGWVAERAEELAKALGPGLHRGEWWGRGIQRGYGLDHRRFSLFNVSKWIESYHNGLLPDGVHVVPTLYKGSNDNYWIQRALTHLRTHGSYAAPGFMNPEGIVIYHTAANTLSKVTLENDDAPKGSMQYEYENRKD